MRHPPWTGRAEPRRWPYRMQRTVFVFDLDGTLVDSVYQHVLAWQEALEGEEIQLSVWRIHRRMGMSGGLFVGALLRETGQPVDAELVAGSSRPTPRPTGTAPGRRASSRGPRAPGPPHRGRGAVGGRDQRADDGGRAHPGAAGGAPRRPGGDPRPGPPCQARPRPVPGRRRTPRRRRRRRGRGRRLGLGPAGRPAGPGPGGRPAVRRLRPRGAGAGRRLPRLRRPGRHAPPPPRRGRGPEPRGALC